MIKPKAFLPCVIGTLRDIRYFQTKLFLTSRRPLSITFATKSYVRSATYIYKFCALYHQKGDFCLFVEHVTDVFSSYQVMM